MANGFGSNLDVGPGLGLPLGHEHEHEHELELELELEFGLGLGLDFDLGLGFASGLPFGPGEIPGLPGDVELAVFFLVGLLGGVHCLGMCGPLVTLYADRLGGRTNALSWRELRQHALFNLGRTASYAAIGAVLGLAGGLVFDAASVIAAGAAVRAVVGVAAGIVIAAIGVGYVMRGTNLLAPIEGAGAFASAYDRIADRVDRWVAGPRIALLGALHGFLPCPLLYPAFLYAFAVGSPVAGAVALGTLGLGTVPTLFLYGTLVGSVPASVRAGLHRALGVAFVALAYLPLSMGLGAVGVDLPRLPVPFYQPLT